jgi:hypothetical protein
MDTNQELTPQDTRLEGGTEPQETTPVDAALQHAHTASDEQEKADDQPTTAEQEAMPAPEPDTALAPTNETVVESNDTQTLELEGEHEVQEHEQEEESVDIESLDRNETAARIKEIIREQNIGKARTVQKLKSHFDHLLAQEEKAARERFIEEGNAAADFEFRIGQDVANINSLVSVYIKSVRQKQQEIEEEKRANLIKKQVLLMNLRELCEEAESKDSFNKLKELQANWKSVGVVPQKDAAEIHKNYTALLDIFYNNRKLFKDMADLDKRKNLEMKEHLIERVEKLASGAFSNKLLVELHQIHDDFKSVGPIPKEQQDAIWERFRGASAKVYELRKQHQEQLLQRWQENLEQKKMLRDQLVALAEAIPAEFKEWQAATDKVLQLAEQWKATGKVPSEAVAEVNRPFWQAYKNFFQHKSAFFKEQDKARQVNVDALKQLISKAEALMDDNWSAHLDQIKALQQEWKAVGPVPRAQQEKLFLKFKKVCDQFFTKKREELKQREAVEVENLRLKNTICEELEQADVQKENLKSYLSEVRSRWEAIGFVPLKQKDQLNDRYKKALDRFFDRKGPMNRQEAEITRLEMELADTGGDTQAADRLLQTKEQAIRKRIAQLESECQNIENNMLMFSKSSKSSGFLAQYEKQVERLKQQIEEAQGQLKTVKSMKKQK